MRGVLALFIVGCSLEAPPAEALPTGDLATFANDVQPILATRCADPTCHGRSERPLALYARGRFRRDPARLFLEEPLAPEELVANARQVAAFAAEAVRGREALADCALLCKPLPAGKGGCEHGGGAVFAARDDREFQTLFTWVGALRLAAP